MGRIDQRLRVGHVVQRRDLTVHDSDPLVDHLHHRREAVGRTRGRRQQIVALWLVEMIIDPDDDVQRVALDRSGHDHLADTLAKVDLEALPGAEPAGALEHDLDTELTPGHVARGGGVAVTKCRPVDGEHILLAVYVLGPAPVDRVECQQVRRRGRVAGQLVDVRERELRPAPGRAQRQPSHAAEAVDADAGAHPCVS